MTVDFTKFPFPSLHQPQAATVTEAIRAEPAASGFVIITLKAADADGFVANVRAFAAHLRARPAAAASPTSSPAVRSGATSSAARCRSISRFARACCTRPRAGRARGRPPEWSPRSRSAMPWRIGCCGSSSRRRSSPPPRRAPSMVATGLRRTHRATTEHTVGAFRNMMRYATVSRDPNVIQFFNLFPSPGKLDVLWPSWQEALPWFFEVGGILSSFPLLALDPTQPMLLRQLRPLRLDQAVLGRHALRSTVHGNPGVVLRAARRDGADAVLLQDRAGVRSAIAPQYQ